MRVRYTIKSSPQPTFTRSNACLFGPLFVFELKHLEQKLHSVNAKIQAKVHLCVFKVETETQIQANQMTWAARSPPLPYSTTKSLLWVMCWLGDNWQVWKKKGWHLWGHADINVTIKKSLTMTRSNQQGKGKWKKMKNNFPHKLIFYKRNRNGWENKRGEQAHRATSVSLLFMTIKHNSFLSVSVSPPLNRPLVLVLSIAVHDLAGAAGARLNCAISYVFTLLASFWAYFSPEHFPSHYSAFPLQRYAVFNLPL